MTSVAVLKAHSLPQSKLVSAGLSLSDGFSSFLISEKLHRYPNCRWVFALVV